MQGGFLDKVVTTALGLRVFRAAAAAPQPSGPGVSVSLPRWARLTGVAQSLLQARVSAHARSAGLCPHRCLLQLELIGHRSHFS